MPLTAFIGSLLWAMTSSGALAQEAWVTLDWSRGPGALGCLDPERLSSTVEQTLGRPIFGPEGSGRLRARITAATGGGYEATVTLQVEGLAPRSRELATGAEDCQRLDDALVLVSALLVDGVEASRPPHLSVPREPPRPRAVTGAIRLGAMGRLGALPGLTLGAGLEAEVAVAPMWPIVFGAWYWPGAEALVDGSGGQFFAVYGSLGLCPDVYRESWVAVGVCGTFAAGVIDAQGVNLNPANRGQLLDLQASLTLAGSLRLVGPLWFRGELGLAATLIPRRFTLQETDGTETEVYRSLPVIPQASLSFELRFL